MRAPSPVGNHASPPCTPSAATPKPSATARSRSRPRAPHHQKARQPTRSCRETTRPRAATKRPQHGHRRRSDGPQLAVDHHGLSPHLHLAERRSATGWPARASSSANSRTIDPIRARAGCTTGIPAATNGPAVIAPTPTTSTSRRNASTRAPIIRRVRNTDSRGRRTRERQSIHLPGQHRVHQTAASGAGISRRHPPVNRNLDDLGARQPPACPRNPATVPRAAERRHAYRRHPSATGTATARRSLSDVGDQASTSPAARTAPFAFGPRGNSTAPCQSAVQAAGQSPPLGGLEPAAEPDRGGGDDDVDRRRRPAPASPSCRVGVVGQRHDPDSRHRAARKRPCVPAGR